MISWGKEGMTKKWGHSSSVMGVASVQAGGERVWRDGGHCRLPSRSLSSPPPAAESWFLVRVATWKHACIPPPSSRQDRPGDRGAQQDVSRHPGWDLSGGSWTCRESTSSSLPLPVIHTVMWPSPSPGLQGDATGQSDVPCHPQARVAGDWLLLFSH